MRSPVAAGWKQQPRLTHRTDTSLDATYDHFNRALLAGALPPCFITMQRHDDLEEATDEMALNPAHLATRAPVDIFSTLVHEMTHLWQHHHGKPSRSGYQGSVVGTGKTARQGVAAQRRGGLPITREGGGAKWDR
jgi:hypothetical protein